ncbi:MULTISPECIES: FAD-dependent monooxygenase [Actinomycetes]|uniref:FAD-dependent monooxygenase n=1 Tax=Actinomycetes TaxID=1760 RepID=UPI0010A82615|nr:MULTISPECIES: FAD-dependent monooxygenase [Actinomycetes]
MANMSALVSGASIAGLSTAYWLARIGWEVTVVERSAAFRDGGQNVDVRGTAHEVVEKMGLTSGVREENTTEEGTAYLGKHGRVLGRIPASREQDGPTAEIEILRGSLAKLILEALPEGVDIRYGDHIEHVTQTATSAEVQFKEGGRSEYDLVIIAEGVRSRTRDLLFTDAVQKRPLGMNMAYGTIPRIDSDDRWWRWYTATGRRGITLRPDNVGTTRATLAYVDREQDISDFPLDVAKARLATIFADAGWEADRVADGFLRSDDVYIDYLTQVKMSSWRNGRVVLTGDAAWCVTPLGGGGTSLALTGAYVLASYLSTESDVAQACDEYERWMRPLITDAQELPKGMPDLFYPNSRAGVAALRAIQRILASKPLRSIAARSAHVARANTPLPQMNTTRA